MKTTLSYLSIISFSLFLLSCGGGDSAEHSKDKQEEGMTKDESMNETPGNELNGIYSLNPEESIINWEGNMLKVGGVSLYGHNGIIKFAKGEVRFENGNLKDGMFVVDMKTIKPTDENYKPEEDRTKERLVGHLSSDDFFAIDANPTSTFQIQGGDMNTVKGTMTIRGKSNTESIEDLNVIQNNEQVIIKGKMIVDRQKYGVAFEMPAKDKVLSDDLELEFKVVLNKA